jgi:hypothetical protein
MLKAEPKKLGALGVLALIFCVAMGRTLLTGHSTPAGATASMVTALESDNSLPRPARESRVSEGHSAGFQEWLHQPINELSRNLFVTRLEYYPQDGSHLATSGNEGDGFWDQVAKSMSSQADHKRERQILLENLQVQASQLRLQSTVMGGRPRALVNGQLLGEGDSIASFKVVRIESRKVLLEREGIRLEITMD